jgi:hypothetical protein
MAAEYEGVVVSKFVMPEDSQWPGKRSVEILLLDTDPNPPLGARVRIIVEAVVPT